MRIGRREAGLWAVLSLLELLGAADEGGSFGFDGVHASRKLHDVGESGFAEGGASDGAAAAAGAVDDDLFVFGEFLEALL